MRILGIDVGSSSIKTVEMDSAFGRYEIHDYHESPIPPGAKPKDVIAKMIMDLPKPPERIITNLSASQYTFRNLQLPTRDKKAIQSGVGFELEDEVPFALEKAVYEWVILDQNKQGSSIHVAAVLKEQMQRTIEFWKESGVEPDFITTDAWAYRGLLNRTLSAEEQEGPTLLIQIGHHKTVFYLHWKGAPALIRETSWGGEDLTLAICQKFGVPLEQAETIKLDRGMLLVGEPQNEPRPEQIELSECLASALEPFGVELRHVHLTSRNFIRKTIHKIYITGGTSLLPGLSSWITKAVGIQTQPLLALSSTASSGVTYSEQTDARFLLATSLAFCLVGPTRSNLINFRKGEFAKVGKNQKIDLRALKKPLLALSAIAASLFLSLTIQSFIYRSRLETINTQLEKSVRGFFGQVSSSALRNYMSDTTKLKNSIQKELNKQRELARLFGPNPHSPLNFLNELSITLPKDVVVDMTQFQVGIPASDSYTKADSQPSTSMSFLVGSPQVAEKISTLLARKVASLEKGKVEEVTRPDSEIKKWKVSFNGKPIEDSNGK